MASSVACLLRDNLRISGARLFEDFDAFFGIELWVFGFDSQHETVVRDPLGIRVVENRVVEPRQTIDAKHSV